MIVFFICRWKGNYRIIPTWTHNGRSFCKICEELHRIFPESEAGVKKQVSKIANIETQDSINPSKYYKVYDDMHKWWVTDSRCLTPDNNRQFYEYIRG